MTGEGDILYRKIKEGLCDKVIYSIFLKEVLEAAMETVGKKKTVPGKEITHIKALRWLFAFFVADKETSAARARRGAEVWEMRLA